MVGKTTSARDGVVIPNNDLFATNRTKITLTGRTKINFFIHGKGYEADLAQCILFAVMTNWGRLVKHR